VLAGGELARFKEEKAHIDGLLNHRNSPALADAASGPAGHGR